jgi:hypothetical protein
MLAGKALWAFVQQMLYTVLSENFFVKLRCVLKAAVNEGMGIPIS